MTHLEIGLAVALTVVSFSLLFVISLVGYYSYKFLMYFWSKF